MLNLLEVLEILELHVLLANLKNITYSLAYLLATSNQEMLAHLKLV